MSSTSVQNLAKVAHNNLNNVYSVNEPDALHSESTGVTFARLAFITPDSMAVFLALSIDQ